MFNNNNQNELAHEAALDKEFCKKRENDTAENFWITENQCYQVLYHFYQYFPEIYGDTPQRHEKAKRLAREVKECPGHRLREKISSFVTHLPTHLLM